MPASSAGFSAAGSAVSDIFGAIGSFASAKGYKAAAGASEQSAEIAAQSARIQGVMADRQITKTLGGQRADIAGAGLKASGSALDLVRDSAQQGSLTKQLIANQGAINVLGYQAEAANYNAMATAAKSSGTGGLISGVISAAAAVFAFSDDHLKEAVVKVDQRRDGLGIYEFNYKGSPQRFRGVLASEVERIYPRAVHEENGYRVVNYSLIQAVPEVVV
jgi:hypothetical protein